MPRKSKLTPERLLRIEGYLRQGLPRVQAAKLSGIGERTFYHWLERGEAQSRGMYWQFLQAVEAAELEAEATLVAAWLREARDDWRGAQAFLERRFPERWAAPKDRGEDEAHRAVYVVREDQLSADEWDELAKRQQAAAAAPGK